MKGMLGWPTRSAKRFVCEYGCCVYHKKDGETPSKTHRQREKRVWKKEHSAWA